MARNSLVIGIDSSTTACKAIAWDKNGQAVAEGRASYPLLSPEPGWREQEAERWWIGTCTALKELFSQVDAVQVEALCLTHQRESFVPVDREGRPLRNAILWLDERSRAEVLFMEQDLGRERLHLLTGKPPSMTQSLPKLIWLARHEPELIARTYKFMDVHAFHTYHFTGAFCTSLASADPMGLVDMAGQAWATGLMQELGLRPDQFVDIVPPGSIIGRVTAKAAAATGLPGGLPVVAGAGDGQCAGLGANAVTRGRAYMNLGTAIASGLFSAEYLTDRAFRTLCAPIPGAYFLETILRGGVFTIAWFIEKFAGDLLNPLLSSSPEEILERAAAKVPPGSAGLMLLPYWNNVMSPYWDPAASGVTLGWNGSHGREHFYRAIMEGIAFEERLVGDAVMAAANQTFEEYVVMGGGSRSELWCQIMADVTGVPMVRSTTSEVTCLGAGILAAAAAGWYADIPGAAAGMTRTARRFTPNPETQALYDRLYREVYQPLFPTLQPLLDRLTELTQEGSRL